MQSFSAANLSCCECPEKFTSASALLHHFARHALERQGKFGEEGNSRYDWQPWRYDDIFKTKRKGHNFLETALLSINETCRKRAKLLAATTVSTCSENSSYSLIETSEAETKGAENDIIPKTQNLSNTSQHVSSKQHSKYTPKTSKPNHTVQETSTTTNSTEFSNLKLITKNDVTQENQNAAKTKCKFSSKNSLNFTANNDVTQENPSTTDIVKCGPNKISPSKLKCKKSKRNNIVEENQSLSVEVSNEIPSNYATDGCKEFSLVEENRSFECETGKFSKQPKLSGDSLKPSTVVQEFQGLENNVESIKNCSVKVSSDKLDETNIIPEKRKLPGNSECRIQKCRKTSLKISINEGKESKNEKFEDEFLENNVDRISDGSELVKIIKIEKSLSKDNNCIVEYSGPEPIESPTSNNLELPLVLRTSDTCVNRTNDDCDVVYDNDDDNNFNLDDSVDKVNCDNNNVITYYNDNSQCKLPKIVCGKDSREGEECKIVREYSIIEEGKRKLSNRKQTTPKKIERIESEFLKIAPRPENLPRDDRVTPNKKGAKKKYCCPLCSRVFGWSTDLKRHILVHTGERPFKCTHCTSSFTRKFLLQKHQNKMHPLNGKTERERLLELKVSENLKELKSKMLELQKSKETGCKQQIGTQNLGANNSKQSTETQNLEKSNCQQLLETQNLGNNNSKQLTENQNLEKNNCKQILETENLENNNSKQQSETLKLGENNSDVVHEEVVIKLEPPYETFFKIEHDSDENWDATSNNNNNNDGEMEFPKGCKNENIVFVEPIAVQSS